MAKRRTHSTIDTLPAGLRDTLLRMVVDGHWPDDVHNPDDGKPTYDAVVLYCKMHGHVISRSAIGRWAKGLLAFERMRSAAGIARKVMGDLTAISMISGAIRDCTQVALKADQYIRSQIADRAKAADQKITEIVTKKQIDPDTLKMIREQIYGIVS